MNKPKRTLPLEDIKHIAETVNHALRYSDTCSFNFKWALTQMGIASLYLRMEVERCCS